MAVKQKVLVIGLDCATPQLVFDRFAGELEHLSRLRQEGCWGELRSVIPAITVPAWACGMTSQDPGQLGIYGFRNRKDHSYGGLAMANSSAVRADAVWDIAGRAGRDVILVAVPPAFPPKPVRGCMVGCFLTPSTESEYTYPAELKGEIARVASDYKVDVDNFRSEDKARILEDVHAMTKSRFSLFRHLLKTRPWDFAMMTEIGIDRVHHGFWQYFDERHHRFDPHNPYRTAVLDYYRAVDREVGAILAGVDDDTTVVVMSDHGAKLMAGGIRINEWLRQEGYLVLRDQPSVPTAFSVESVDWSRTKVWGEGGYYGRVFVNVRGREPEGIVDVGEYEGLRDELCRKLAAIADHEGRDIGTRVFKPAEIYRVCNNVPPDLIVYFGDLDWRSVATVGGGALHTFENDTGPDDANHAEQGIFIMKGAGIEPGKALDGLEIVDCGPTFLRRLGESVPETMIGRVIGR